MDKAQKSLIDTYYRKRAIAASQSPRYKYLPYEYSKYALENKIMDFSKLSIGDVYEIYSTNPDVQQYVKPIIDTYNKKSTGFLKILLNYENSDNYKELENFITNSNFYKENCKGIYFHSNYFIIKVDNSTILNILNLEDNYDYVTATANGYYNDRNVDTDELNYMQRTLSNTNMSKINKIAKMMGADDETISEFYEESNLTDFLNEHKLDVINDVYLSEYSQSFGEAEAAAANEQLETFPLVIDNNETSIDINKILHYIYKNNLKNISTFDQFLENLKTKNNINYENINNDAYNHMDLTELNQAIDDKLVDIINGFDDPDSDYYGLVKGYTELQEYISKYKFTPVNKKGIIATYKQQDKTINITEFKYDENEEDNKKLKFKIHFIYNGGKTPFERSGWIFASNLGNYIKQQEIKIMREAIQIS
jgi:hypothetical protein